MVSHGGEYSVNIILVSSSLAKTRSITVSWRHYALSVLAGFILLVGLATVLNYSLLRYATAINHPWLQAIVLSDQRHYTLPVAIANLVGEHVQDAELMMASSVLTVLPVLAVFIALQRYYIAGIMAGSVKG